MKNPNAATAIPLSAFSSIKTQDDIFENVETFINHPVVDYPADKKSDGTGKTIYRFRSDWDEDSLIPDLQRFLASDTAANAQGLVIGAWSGDDPERTPEYVFEVLKNHKDRLPSLGALYIGDITQEESEMSWITQSDLSVLLESFPELQFLRARGGSNLSINNPAHAKLRGLALEAGGLPADVVRSVCISDFPSLEYLELWLGTPDYGGDSTIQDLQPILSGALFPNLKYLGLRNCEYVDDIATVIVNSPIIDRIETLDLSLGLLTDAGAKALLSLPTDAALKEVSIHYNYVSDDLVKQLDEHALSIDTSKPSDMEDEDEWRYIAVGE